MGADYSAYAVIGVRLNPDDFITESEKTVAGCGHKHDSKFCPDCGAPKSRKTTKTVDLLEEEVWCDDDKWNGLDLVFGTDHKEVYLGVVCQGSYSNAGPIDSFMGLKADGSEVSAIREKLKNVLEPLDLWYHGDFGLWSVLYCSY